jgi:hypothetical protein
VIFVNLNLDVIDQEVENETVKNHTVNDDIDQVCLLKEKKTVLMNGTL